MTWFKVDDNLAFHQKVLIAGNAAMGLWVRAGSWCGQQLSDGFVPDKVVSMLGTPKEAAALVDCRLWDRVKGGYRFHQWEDHQPTRAEVEAKREADRQRKADWRASKSSQRDSARTDAVTPRGVREESALPVPSRPDPTRMTTNTRSVSPVSDRARNAGLTDRGITSIINTVSLHCDIDATAAEAIELAEHITSKAKTAPRSVPAYVRNAIENGPSEIDAWFRARRRPLRAVGQ